METTQLQQNTSNHMGSGNIVVGQSSDTVNQSIDSTNVCDTVEQSPDTAEQSFDGTDQTVNQCPDATDATDQPSYTVVCVETPDEGWLDAQDLIINRFDRTFGQSMYHEDGDAPSIYHTIRRAFRETKDGTMEFPIITLAADSAVSAATITGLAEASMYCTVVDDRTVYGSHLRVVYIDPSFDLSFDYGAAECDRVVAECLGATDHTFTGSRVSIDPKNMYFLATNPRTVGDNQRETAARLGLQSFDLDVLRRKGIEPIVHHIAEECADHPVHVVFDLACMSGCIAPSVRRNYLGQYVDECETKEEDGRLDGLSETELGVMIDSLLAIRNIRSVDITGYCFGDKKVKSLHDPENLTTVRTIETILSRLIDIPKQSINIVTKSTQFLIYKPMIDDDPIGWKIFPGLSMKTRERLIGSIDPDSIETISINTGDDLYYIYLTTTTMEEQEQLSYHTAESYLDRCLCDEDKVSMMFRMLDTVTTDEEGLIVRSVKHMLETMDLNVDGDDESVND